MPLVIVGAGAEFYLWPNNTFTTLNGTTLIVNATDAEIKAYFL